MSGILCSGKVKDDIPVTGLRFSDPETGETRLDPKFEGTGKALLGQHLQAKGDTILTKVSDWLSERQPGNVLKGSYLSTEGLGLPGKWAHGAVDRTWFFIHQRFHLYSKSPPLGMFSGIKMRGKADKRSNLVAILSPDVFLNL